MYVCLLLCIFTIDTCITHCTHTYRHTHIQSHALTFTHMLVCMYVCILLSVYRHICMYARLYVVFYAFYENISVSQSFFTCFCSLQWCFCQIEEVENRLKKYYAFFSHTFWRLRVCPEYQYSLWCTLKFEIICQFGLSGGDVPSQNDFYRGSHARKKIEN